MKPVVKIFKYVGISLIAILGVIVFVGAVNGASDAITGDKSYSLEHALKAQCECENINQIIYLKGIQYSAGDGLSTELAEFELTNCKYNSLAEEATRINDFLSKQVYNYEDLDVLKLEFIGKEKHETVVIRNGIIQ